MHITSKGHVTIPQDIRDFAGFQRGTEVEFVSGDDGVVGVVAAGQGIPPQGTRLEAAVSALRGAADAGLSTDQIMAPSAAIGS